jgi:hypothetical protein
MDGLLNILKCIHCSFYFTKSKSNDSDYSNYYLTHNNYAGSHVVWHDRNRRTAEFLLLNLDSSVKTIIDYGAGNGSVSQLLASKFSVTSYDIGEPEPTKEYDCLVLSHVLEHIYDVKGFISLITRYVRDNGFVYIEIPDGSEYHNMGDLGILQEINIEHINFFSPYSVSKLMVENGYTPVILKQGICYQRELEYRVIYSIFQKTPVNSSVERYIHDGNQQLEILKNTLPDLSGRVFIYGCGQFLYKILSTLQNKYTIECIIDDNPNFKDKTLNTLRIVPLTDVKDILSPSDNVIIVVGKLYAQRMQENLKSVCSSLNVVTL